MKFKILLNLIFILCICFLACSGSATKETPSETTSEVIMEQDSETDETNEKSSDMNDTMNEENEVEESISEGEASEESEEQDEKLPPDQIAKADEIIAAVKASEVEAVDSKKLFRTHCAICHGFKGNMMVNGAKDLTKSKIPLNEAVAQVYHGKGLMTPYKGILSDTEIVALAKYSETLR